MAYSTEKLRRKCRDRLNKLEIDFRSARTLFTRLLTVHSYFLNENVFWKDGKLYRVVHTHYMPENEDHIQGLLKRHEYDTYIIGGSIHEKFLYIGQEIKI